MNLDLQSLIRPLDGYNKDVPGYDHRKGWNDAIMHIMDLQRATAAPASAAHSNKLRSSLENVAESLSSRPRELRGPFDSGATATEIASLRRELAELREDKRIVDELLDAAITDYNEARHEALEEAANLAARAGLYSYPPHEHPQRIAFAIRNLAGEKADG